MRAFFNHRATVTRPGTKTLRDGSVVVDDHATPQFVDDHDNLNIQPLVPHQDVEAAGDVDTERLAGQTPPGVFIRIQAGDQVTYRGNTYRVDGLVAAHYDPLTGAPHHQEFTLTRTLRGPGRG